MHRSCENSHEITAKSSILLCSFYTYKNNIFDQMCTIKNQQAWVMLNYNTVSKYNTVTLTARCRFFQFNTFSSSVWTRFSQCSWIKNPIRKTPVQNLKHFFFSINVNVCYSLHKPIISRVITYRIYRTTDFILFIYYSPYLQLILFLLTYVPYILYKNRVYFMINLLFKVIIEQHTSTIQTTVWCSAPEAAII